MNVGFFYTGSPTLWARCERRLQMAMFGVLKSPTGAVEFFYGWGAFRPGWAPRGFGACPARVPAPPTEGPARLRPEGREG